MPPPRPPPPLQLAGFALVFRPTPVGVQLCWVKDLGAGGTFFSLPGGAVEPVDRSVAVQGVSGDEAAQRSAAARSLFARTSLLVGAGAESLTASRRFELRGALVSGALSWTEALAEAGVSLAADDLRPAGRWVSAAFMPVRFDASVYLLEAPASAELQTGDDGAWTAPADALALWQRGAALLLPMTLHALKTMAQFRSVDQTRAELATPPFCPGFIPTRLEIQEGVRVFPLETATLPPASHTNAYLLGNEELLIVDPGSADVRQYSKLLSLIASLRGEGKRPKAIFLTHHHGDHVGGARAVKDRLGVPLWCHALTADRLPFPVDRRLEDGESIRLEGRPTQQWTVLHTPGHARGHLTLVDERSRAAVVGDMVASVGSIVIDPPEGEMAEYLKQLARLRDLPVATLYPAHGMPVADGPQKLQEYLDHRAAREARVLGALGPEPSSLTEVVQRAYSDTPAFLLPVAERSALATLEKLIGEGKVHEAEGRYCMP